MGPYESVLAGRDEQIALSPLSTSGDWSYQPQSRSIFHHQCVRGKAIKTASLFLSIMRISTRFSEIPPRPPRALKIWGILPLKCFLMDCSEVSETLVRLECSFWISVYLFGAEVANFEVWVCLNFPFNQIETRSPVHWCPALELQRTLECVCMHRSKH